MEVRSGMSKMRRGLMRLVPVLALTLGAAANTMAQEAGGPREGITVHGHWIIEVLNPDGTQAQRREFENALVPQGAGLLANLLSAQKVPSTWFVWFGSTAAAQPCVRLGFPTSCGITTPLGAQGTVPTEFFPTLSVTAPATGANAGKVIFTGNATSTGAQPSTINYVLTQLWMCPSSGAAGVGCGSATSQANFTEAQVTPAIPLVPGQIVQVTVIISFS